MKLEEASVKSVTNILAKREGLDRLISNDNQRILNKAETGGIEITRRVGSMRDTVKALGDALASKTYSEDSIRSILAKGETGAVAHLKPEMKTDFAKYVHHEDAAKRIQGFDIEALAGEVEQKAEGLQKQAKELANKVLKLHNERASDTKIKAAADELRELESKNPDYVRRIGKSVNDHLSETEREIFKKIKGAEGLMESYSKAASSGTASSTTSKGRSFVSTILYKNEEALGKVASELRKPVSELSTWQKIHGGKLAGWAIAAGVVAYIAGIGRNPDSGKYTSAENERRATPSSQQIGA